MSNTFFQFRQFTVFQDLCAMKVGTDGVLLGAWADCENANHILDVGTGTGLIALMLAQRSKALITGIDLEESAFRQAQHNVNLSPFAERIEIQHCDFLQFEAEKTFDLIVSNPPYFVNSLKAPDNERSNARHNDSLPLEKLLSQSISLLSPQGRIALVLPSDLLDTAEKTANELQLYNTRKTFVKTTLQKTPKRVLLEYSRLQPTEQHEDILCIELARHKYSDEFAALTKDFYLK